MANRHHNLVAERASRRCEYCHFPEAFSQLRFVCDHIIARKHDGTDEPGNLAYSCPHCNSHKLDNIAGLDPGFPEPVRLFNPRRDTWEGVRHDGCGGPRGHRTNLVGESGRDTAHLPGRREEAYRRNNDVRLAGHTCLDSTICCLKKPTKTSLPRLSIPWSLFSMDF